jgi:hypothetical protein
VGTLLPDESPTAMNAKILELDKLAKAAMNRADLVDKKSGKTEESVKMSDKARSEDVSRLNKQLVDEKESRHPMA